MNGTIKIADFGLVRQIRAKPPFTEYVSTRWYRSPQVILRSTNYNSPMDIFAIGAIMVQLYTKNPLFPGVNEKDQINRILKIMGTPSKQQWPQGYKAAAKINFQMPQYEGIALNEFLPNITKDALDLINSLLQVVPQKRITAQQALKHQYFHIKTILSKPIEIIDINNHKDNSKNWMQNIRYKPGTICKI